MDLYNCDFYIHRINCRSRRASLVAQSVKSLPAMWESWVRPWVGKIPWRKKWQPTPVVLPKKSRGTEEPGGLQSVGLQKSWT